MNNTIHDERRQTDIHDGTPRRAGLSTHSADRTDDEAGHNLDRRRFLAGAGAGIAASVGIAGPASAQETPVVAVGNTYFDPIGLYVDPGTTVRFEIQNGSHSVTAYDDRIPPTATPFDSEVFSDGAFEHRFDTPGTYDYYCRPHRSLQVARIVVGEPGGPAENTPIPDGEVPDSSEIVRRKSVPVDEYRDDTGGSGGHMGNHECGNPPWPMFGGGAGGWRFLPTGIIAAIVGAVGLSAVLANRKGRDGSTNADPALQVLRERHERGELDREQFDEMRNRLR